MGRNRHTSDPGSVPAEAQPALTPKWRACAARSGIRRSALTRVAGCHHPAWPVAHGAGRRGAGGRPLPRHRASASHRAGLSHPPSVFQVHTGVRSHPVLGLSPGCGVASLAGWEACTGAFSVVGCPDVPRSAEAFLTFARSDAHLPDVGATAVDPWLDGRAITAAHEIALRCGDGVSIAVKTVRLMTAEGTPARFRAADTTAHLLAMLLTVRLRLRLAANMPR